MLAAAQQLADRRVRRRRQRRALLGLEANPLVPVAPLKEGSRMIRHATHGTPQLLSRPVGRAPQ